MTGANRVSNLYASVAEADDDSDADPLRPAGVGAERRAQPAPRQPRADAGGLQERAAPPAASHGKGSEQGPSAATEARRRNVTAAPAASRTTLLRRAALAGLAIVLLGVGLIVSEDDAPAQAATPLLGAGTADNALESGAGDEPAATASTPAAVAPGSEEGGADGPPVAAVGPETEAAGASDDAATPREAGQAGAPRAPDPLGPAQDGAAHAAASQASTSPSATSQPGTASRVPAQPGTAQAATTQAGRAPVAVSANTLAAPISAPAPPSDVAKAGSAPLGGTAAPASGPPANEKQPPAAAPSVRPAPPPPASTRALAQGHIVQLGVFGDPENAAILSQELAAQGYPAHLQSRVVLGPFANRQTAKAAAERLRAERKLEGIVVPPRKP